MITVKEEFLRDPKLLRAIKLGGHEAFTLWMVLKAYAAANPTDGFVPDEVIEDLCAGLVRAPRKRMQALVDCGKLRQDGSRGAGLVDPVELGWQLHDYLDHATSSDEVVERVDKERERKRAQRERAKLRRVLIEGGMDSDVAEDWVRALSRDEVQAELARRADGGQDGPGTEAGHVPGHGRDNGRDMSRDTGGDTSRAPAPPRPPAHAPPRARTRASAHPSPTQPSPTIKDDHDHGTEGSARIPKPKDSPLRDRELAQLEVDCPGLPRAFAELAVRDWLGEPADPADQRFPRQWKTHAIKLVRGSWRDAKRRRELLSVLEGGGPEAAAPPPVSAEETERFELEVERQRARQVARGLARAGAEEREQTLAELERHSPREARLVRQLLEGAA